MAAHNTTITVNEANIGQLVDKNVISDNSDILISNRCVSPECSDMHEYITIDLKVLNALRYIST